MDGLVLCLDSAKRLLNLTSAAIVFKDRYVLLDDNDAQMVRLIAAFRLSPFPKEAYIANIKTHHDGDNAFWAKELNAGGVVVKSLDIPSQETAFLILLTPPGSFSSHFHQDLAFIESALKSAFQSQLNLETEDLLSLSDENSSLVAVLDSKLCVQYANRRALKSLTYEGENVLGKSLEGIVGGEVFSRMSGYLHKALDGEKSSFQIAIEGADQELILDVTCSPRRRSSGIEGVYLVAYDVTLQRKTLQTLRKLHAVTADPTISLEQKLQDILSVGAAQYDLPVGIISSIDGDTYTIEFSVTPDNSFSSKMTFNLGETYCVHALKNDQPTFFHHVAQSEIKHYACYKKYGLEAYIGAVLMVNGKRWGTLCFSGTEPKKSRFTEDDIELMKLLTQWVGNELTRYHVLQDLAASEQQQRLLLNSAYDGFLGIDINGDISFANKAACHITGYEQDELLGKNHHTLLHHSHVDGSAYLIEDCPVTQTLLTGKNSQSSAEPLWGKHGVFIGEYNCVAMKDTNGSIEGAVITFQDRTEQLEVEQEIREQKKLFETLFLDAPSAIILVNELREIVMVNTAFCDLFGYSDVEVIGNTTEMFYADEEDFLRIGEEYYSPNTSSTKMLNLVTYKKKNGEIFYCETAGSAILGKDGVIEGYIGHLNDISDRLRVEKEILKANQRFSMAANASGIGVWEWDLRTNSLDWDDWMYHLFGVEKADVDRPFDVWLSSVHPDDKVALDEKVEAAIQGYGLLDTHFRIVRQDGQIRHLKANGVIEHDQEGNPIRFIGVNLDITSHMETEAILRKASYEAEMASKAKSDFLATMSHEIRTPLNGVLGMAELLASSPLDSEQLSHLGILRESGESLLELINEILDFSKIEAGQLTIEFVDFDLEKTIYDIVRILMISAEKKGLELLVKYPGNLPKTFVGDVFRIKQVLINLINNAIKFTFEGQVVISVSAFVDDLGHADLSIEVKDSGVGISDDVQKVLFKPFTQADSSTTRKFGGTGLGLAITKQLIELMGGRISLCSAQGKGSAFTIFLRLPESYIKPVNQTVDFSHWKNVKTLIVDDNDINITILKSQLHEFGMTCVLENDARKAFDHIQRGIAEGNPFELIILDYQMPDLDGLMLSRLVREISNDSYAPAIVIASSAGYLNRSLLQEAGVNVCLTKPVDSRTLAFGLDKALNSRILGELVSHLDHDVIMNDASFRAANTHFQGRVLVAEDMMANIAVARGLIEKMGLEFIDALNGREAVDKWQEHQPDLILMDLHMPVMDGLSAMRAIRHIEKESGAKTRVPIYALTADALRERIADVERAGGDGLIPKPFKKNDLIKVFKEYLMSYEAEHADTVKTEMTPVTSEKHLDEQVLNDLKGILGDDLNMLIDAFFLDSADIISKLKSELANDPINYDVVAKAAHSMKSISLNLGGRILSEFAGQLEKQAKLESADCESLIESLLTEYDLFIEALNKER